MTNEQPGTPDNLAPVGRDELEALASEQPVADEPIPEIYVGPDDDPAIGPITLKEAYGEALGTALAWNEQAALAAAGSSASADDAFVNSLGVCPAWTFTFVAPLGDLLDIDVIHGQAAPNPYPAEQAGEPFALEDLADSEVLIARARAAGLEGSQFILRLVRNEAGTIVATVQSLETLASVTVDPSL